jgi:hypothetical protein
MGMLTDFFVASPTELEAAFPTFLPVADQPEMREQINPFTLEKMQVPHWIPAERASQRKRSATKPGKSRRSGSKPKHDVRALPHVMYKRVDHVKLATLWGTWEGIEFLSAIDAIAGAKPPLVEPDDDQSSGLTRLPDGFVDALSDLDDKTLKAKAKLWAQSDEWVADGATAKDLVEVLTELRRLAKTAKTAGKYMYLWWSV